MRATFQASQTSSSARLGYARMRRFLRTPRVARCAAFVIVMMLMPAAGAHAATWTNEQGMVDSANFRDTFVADPGRGHRWERTDLIRDYRVYYVARQRGNILFWAPQTTIDPGGAAIWAGCNPLSGPIVDVCPDGSPLALHEMSRALADTRITALAWDGAFIALGCGNFSGRQVAGPIPTIAGKKFEDVDGDGARDAGEPLLGGWTIQLYQDGRFLAQTVTDGDGNYDFALDANSIDIRSENFELREVQQNGWTASRTPAAITVPFGSANAVFAGNDFGNYRPATIDGVKYEDMEADGDRDADDPVLENWTIALGAGPSAPGSDVTDGSGEYAFTGLRPGTYTVAEQLKDGWRYSAPADGSHTITLSSGENARANFGNYRPATIEGVKFDDHDVDGLRSTADGGLENWTIALSGGRSPDASNATDPDGRYAFTGLIPGTYDVDEAQKPGWRQSAPETGNHTVTVRSGDTKMADFGNVCLGTSRVLITEETTGAPLSGVEVRIEEIAVPGVLDNEPVLPRTTSGTPTFADLLPGTYRVIAFLPAGIYTTDPALTVVDGRLAVVKVITVLECATTDVAIKLFARSTGKVTGGMKMLVPGGYATAGYVFMTRSGIPEGSLEYIDHATGMNLHSEKIEQIHVRGNEAWIGGLVVIDGETHRFSLHLVDNGEPGSEDRFELLIETGYRAGYDQTIEGGNDQVHKPERT